MTENTGEVLVANSKHIKSKHYLKGNPVSIFCTNLESIMQNRTNLWGKSRTRLAIKNEDGTKASPNVFSTGKASYNDGKLEFAAFNNLIGLITNR